MTQEQLDALADKMKAAFPKARNEPFEAPLYLHGQPIPFSRMPQAPSLDDEAVLE